MVCGDQKSTALNFSIVNLENKCKLMAATPYNIKKLLKFAKKPIKNTLARQASKTRVTAFINYIKNEIYQLISLIISKEKIRLLPI